MDERITRWMNKETKWMDGWMDRNKKKLKRRTKKWTENLIILMLELLESSICLFFLEYKENVHVLIIVNVCFFL